MKNPQSILGQTGMLFFLVIISAFPPLTIDLYLPALPTMVEALNTNQSMVNLTLSSYFVTYATGLLFWGPLSEKFGRKPILLIGICGYILASIGCALSANIEQLIGVRVLQAFAASAVTVVATAIVKDSFTGREREKIMATIMSLVIIAPMVAPVIGAFLLQIASWRMMFVVLAIYGTFAAILALCYQETLEKKYVGSVLRSWGRLAVIIKNPRFAILLVVFSMTSMALMGFLAAGSYIYINDFGLTEQQFSYAFAFNAMCAAFGPMIYMHLSRYITVKRIITLCFILLTIAGVLTLSIGHMSALTFAVIAAPATVAIITMRVPGTNLMLEQQTQDTGSAVALIQFSSMMSGALGMVLVSISQASLISNLGIIQLSVGLLGATLWIVIKNKPFVTDNLINKH
ncbi:multidrug effflux MFS transporter [Shewanella sp. 10N.286.51.B7]|uniref:multidrug effflux MFS transporter n=1 Tax=Shewanella sp. 10N.286.51.B7 TaxID=1880836 RepID=UPI0018E4C72D|nr:multidrug effflux MFS transporter [Shewanella sp. 10N.286.51.B7]